MRKVNEVVANIQKIITIPKLIQDYTMLISQFDGIVTREISEARLKTGSLINYAEEVYKNFMKDYKELMTKNLVSNGTASGRILSAKNDTDFYNHQLGIKLIRIANVQAPMIERLEERVKECLKKGHTQAG